MNKKGFTLVELLAVVVILALILAIAVPTIISIIDASRTNASIINKQMLIKATKNYLISHSAKYPAINGSSLEIKLSDLQSNLILSDIKDPKNQNVDCNGYIY